MDDKIVVIRRFDSPIEANIIKGLLEANEIQCFLSDENIIGLNPLYNPAIGGVKLQIFEKDIEIVEKILAENHEIKTDEDKAEVLRCPKCGSTNVAYGQSIKRRFSLLMLITSFILMIYPFRARMNYHCFDCGYEF
jgi:DNA-directed RNA polymerase subunit RPC12/RpoP